MLSDNKDKNRPTSLEEEVVRGKNAWHTCDGGVRGLVYTPERVREIIEQLKIPPKSFWRKALPGVISLTSISCVALLLYLINPFEREGMYRLDAPIVEVSNVETYKGKIINGITKQEARNDIDSSLNSFCERGYVGNGDGLFCSGTGITPSLFHLLDVVGIINKNDINSSSIMATFGERTILYDKSVEYNIGMLVGKDYTLKQFSEHVLENEHDFLWWVGKTYGAKMDYGKIKDLESVLTFPSLAQQKTDTGIEYYFVGSSALPQVNFRLIYTDDSKKDILLSDCKSLQEIVPFCKKMKIDISKCSEVYWEELGKGNALNEIACRLQKKIPRDINTYGDTAYELILVKWTTQSKEYTLRGKASLSDQERVDKIYHLIDLLETYKYLEQTQKQ